MESLRSHEFNPKDLIDHKVKHPNKITIHLKSVSGLKNRKKKPKIMISRRWNFLIIKKIYFCFDFDFFMFLYYIFFRYFQFVIKNRLHTYISLLYAKVDWLRLSMKINFLYRIVTKVIEIKIFNPPITF